MWDAHTTQLTVSVALSTFLHHLWLKLMDHPCCWVAYYQFIYQMWWGCFTGPFVAQTLTVLGQSSVHIWGKVSTPGPNKWYGLNGRGNDFYPSSLFWPKGGWRDRPDIPFYNFTPEHYLDLMLLKVKGKGNIKRNNYYKNRDYYQMNIKSMNDLLQPLWQHFHSVVTNGKHQPLNPLIPCICLVSHPKGKVTYLEKKGSSPLICHGATPRALGPQHWEQTVKDSSHSSVLAEGSRPEQCIDVKPTYVNSFEKEHINHREHCYLHPPHN